MPILRWAPSQRLEVRSLRLGLIFGRAFSRMTAIS
jgi:hypothetical protein